MKKTLIATTLLISSGLIFAAEQGIEHNHQSPSSQQTQGEKGMMTEEAMSTMMMKDMEKMHSQMAVINKTVDPAKRDELLQDHLATMHNMMETMHKMHGGSGAMMGQENMANQMYMMQMMMDQMIQNQQATEKNRILREKGHAHTK